MNKTEFTSDFLYVIGKLRQYGGNPLQLHTIDIRPGVTRLVQPYTILRTFFEMAEKKPSRKAVNFRDMTFINFKMTADMKADFDAWYAAKGNGFINAVWETLQSSHKLGLSWDNENDCFIASMTGKEDSMNPSKCLTMRSKDWIKALAACAYVHTVIYSAEVWDDSNTTDLV